MSDSGEVEDTRNEKDVQRNFEDEEEEVEVERADDDEEDDDDDEEEEDDSGRPKKKSKVRELQPMLQNALQLYLASS